jgi:hypothetical protein
VVGQAPVTSGAGGPSISMVSAVASPWVASARRLLLTLGPMAPGLLDYLASEPDVRQGGIGTTGYCRVGRLR